MVPVAAGSSAVNQEGVDQWQELKLKIQADVYKQSVRLQDFLAPFDKHRRGLVIEPNFERALAVAGITLTPENMEVIRSKFGVKQKSQALIAYLPFLDLINTVFGPLNLEQNPHQVVIDGKKLTANYEHKIALCLRQPDSLSPEQISLLEHSVQRIKDRIFKLRFDPSSKFRDFDKFNSGSVSKVQFHKCLNAAGFNFSNDVIQLLSRQYASGRHVDHVDYRKFLADITQDRINQEVVSHKDKKAHPAMSCIKSEKPYPETLEGIIQKMKKATSGYSVRFIDYMRDADPLRRNSITKFRLAAVLSSIADINLTDKETSLLQQMFPHEVERDAVNYQKLTDSIQNEFKLKDQDSPPGSNPVPAHNGGNQISEQNH